LRLGIDVDGVLANFSKGYAKLITEMTGKNLFEPGDVENPPVWDWDRHRGYTKEEVKATWDHIVASPTFWAELEPFADTQEFLMWLGDRPEYETYFITNRMNTEPQLQTAFFLSENGYPYPSVVIASDKGRACHGLGIDVYLDDKGENIISVLNGSPDTTAILKCFRHNEKFVPAITDALGLTVDTLEQFSRWVDGYNNREANL
jgi:hypothetical protein